MTSPKRISILGATGSVGKSAVKLLSQHPDRFKVVALTGHQNVTLLAEQARLLRPEIVAIGNEAYAPILQEALQGLPISILSGDNGVKTAAMASADCILAAIVGVAGLPATAEAIKQGTTVALANKESLVASGTLMKALAQQHGTTIIPVDSEHSAIFQVFESHNRSTIEKLILTASGGPFYQKPLSELKHITPEQAVKHPNWSMGKKISVDSATLVNKALELIEAHFLFDMPPEQLDVVIHPQSIVHSLVSYNDGSVLAQLGMPDMTTPIAYGLYWPQRLNTSVQRLSLETLQTLTFYPAPEDRFVALRLARESLQNDHCLVLNAANEAAVAAFLKNQLPFLAITSIIEEMLQRLPSPHLSHIQDVIDYHDESVQKTVEFIQKNAI